MKGTTTRSRKGRPLRGSKAMEFERELSDIVQNSVKSVSDKVRKIIIAAQANAIRALPLPAATPLTASDSTEPGPVAAESALAKYLCPIGAENGSVTCSAGSCPECAAARADAMIAQRDAALKLARDALTESGESLQLIGECRLDLGGPGDGKDRKADAEDTFGVYATLRRITRALATIDDAIGAKP